VIELPSGTSDVDVRFVRTPDRWIGDGISLAALLVILASWRGERGILQPQRRRDTEQRRVKP